jgi:hypothetical protein
VRPLAIFGGGVAVGALAAALLLRLLAGATSVEDPPAVRPAEPAKAPADVPPLEKPAAPAREAADRREPLGYRDPGRPDGSEEDTPPPLELLDPAPQAEWDALVGGVLEREVENRLGRTLEPERKARLLAHMAQLRDASLGLQLEEGDPDDPAVVRAQLMRTLAIVQADQAFRAELGIGVSDFLQGLDPAEVEDVAPTSRR